MGRSCRCSEVPSLDVMVSNPRRSWAHAANVLAVERPWVSSTLLTAFHPSTPEGPQSLNSWLRVANDGTRLRKRTPSRVKDHERAGCYIPNNEWKGDKAMKKLSKVLDGAG